MQLNSVKILVTGAAGFLGSHLLPRLLEAGAQVTCLIRSKNASLPEDVRPLWGDCVNGEQAAAAVRGQDMVIHMAGLLFGASWQDYFCQNSLMASNLAAAAQTERQLQKFIFVSSLAASGPCAGAPGRSEAMPPEPVSAYGWSKLLAENIIRAHLGQKAVILRPPIIYGSGDGGLLPLFKACGRGISVGRNFNVSAIHSSDCARALVHLATIPSEGIYHINDGHIYSMDDLSLAMAQAQGRESVRLFHLPRSFMAMSAAVASGCHTALARAARILALQAPKPPRWNWDKYREACQCGWVADGTRLERTGFQAQMSLAQGMAEAVAFYRREGWL